MTTKTRNLNVLSFNPKTDEYNSFIVDLSPEQAQYILDYHNRDNRKMSNSQVNKIFRSIENDNWLLDGQPMTFNTDGNLTEFQHRLKAITKCQKNRTFKVVVVTGVQPDCFSKTATNKKRNPIDEIQRKYDRAHKDEVSILGDIMKRQRKMRLSMQNAISSYENWFKNISNSLKISGDYENVMDKFSLQRKTLRAYMALCERHGYLEECKIFLELLDNELEEDSEICCTLSSQFLKFWNSTAVDLSNEKRMDVLFSMLCVATDRIIMRDDGMIDLNVNSHDLENESMEKMGVYRKFIS
jgi:hypothetical protein